MFTNKLHRQAYLNQTTSTQLLYRVKYIIVLRVLLISLLFSSCNTKPNTESTPEGNKSVKHDAPASNPDQSITPANPPANFQHASANVNGVKIHYVIGGKGEPLLLVHGFGQNWYMWNRILPELSKHFTVIAPDLRGVGESDKPSSGYDKKNMATDMHELMKSLGYSKINLAGHDIGLMVAYAYAAMFPDDVKKLALLDALLPGIEPVWSQVKAGAWWFGFFGFGASGDLVAGRERMFLTNFWPLVGFKNDSFTKDEIDEFVRAYAVTGGTTGAFHWFGAFSQDAIDFKELGKVKLKMPVLTLGSDHFAAPFLGKHIGLVANNVKDVPITESGHWVVQEQTDQVLKAMEEFYISK